MRPHFPLSLDQLADFVTRLSAITFDLRDRAPTRTVEHRRGCRCHRRHRTWQRFAWCVWPDAHWIVGTGPWALVSRCGTAETITLHPTRAEAFAAADALDVTGCGHDCRQRPRRHPVVRLEVDPMGLGYPKGRTNGDVRGAESGGGHG